MGQDPTTHLKCISVSSSYRFSRQRQTKSIIKPHPSYLMLPQRLSLQVDNAFFRPAILGKPLRNAASVRLGRILAGRRCRQIRVRDLFGHFCFGSVDVVQVASEELVCYLSSKFVLQSEKPIVSGVGLSRPRAFAVEVCVSCIVHAIASQTKVIKRSSLCS